MATAIEVTQSPRRTALYIVSRELAKISSLLPSNPMRSIIVHSLVDALGLLAPSYSLSRRLVAVTPKRTSPNTLAMYHTQDYLDFILNPENTADVDVTNMADFGLEDDCPMFKGLSEYAPLVAGATLTAVSALVNGLSEEAICWDGGRHHAQKSHASGFCYVADCILALLALKRCPPLAGTPNRKPRIMYLDLDLHFSDAVSQAFYSTRPTGNIQVMTLSLHHAAPGFFPLSELSALPNPANATHDAATLSIPLHKGASDTTYARVWKLVEKLKDTYNPDFVVVQCGLDALAGDPCATFNWSLGTGDGSLGWCVDRIHKEWSGKKLYLGGGGYHSANAARAWAYLTSIILDNPLPLDTNIPDHPGFPLYAPSFTLDVPAGNMLDENTEAYLQSVEERYETIISSLQERLEVRSAA
ncbi:histone deacetylase complex protein [Pleurotus eryngii]|uniref:Histone deacetylase 8 n=1 Tax=Pleurotus eryngii TaxID=5323 RepID=A0A9P6DLC0_PLEER|nr:histone deacetylase complex protein [Pleurotus eryngii]